MPEGGVLFEIPIERRVRNRCPKCEHYAVTYRWHGNELYIDCLNDSCKHSFKANRVADRQAIIDWVGND